MESSSPLDWLSLDSVGTVARLKTSNSGGQRLVPLKHRNVRKSSVLGHSPLGSELEAAEVNLLFLVVGPEAVEDPEDC